MISLQQRLVWLAGTCTFNAKTCRSWHQKEVPKEYRKPRVPLAAAAEAAPDEPAAAAAPDEASPEATPEGDGCSSVSDGGVFRPATAAVRFMA